MIKLLLILLIFGMFFIGSVVFAQHQGRTNFYSGTGRYVGRSHTRGNTTTYYGSAGRFLGRSYVSGRNTSYYGATGRYVGRSHTSIGRSSIGRYGSGYSARNLRDYYISGEAARDTQRYYDSHDHYGCYDYTK